MELNMGKRLFEIGDHRYYDVSGNEYFVHDWVIIETSNSGSGWIDVIYSNGLQENFYLRDDYEKFKWCKDNDIPIVFKVGNKRLNEINQLYRYKRYLQLELSEEDALLYELKWK